jgi:hypothetical protein
LCVTLNHRHLIKRPVGIGGQCDERRFRKASQRHWQLMQWVAALELTAQALKEGRERHIGVISAWIHRCAFFRGLLWCEILRR